MEQHSVGKPVQGRLAQLRDVVPRSIEFVRESWGELKKVHWPSRKETYSATVIVVVVVVVMALFLGLVDFALSQLMRRVLS